MKYLVVSTSLAPASRSRVLARHVHGALPAAQWIDLAELELPFCDAHDVWTHPVTETLQSAVTDADGIVLALGIYNYTAPAAAKAVLELAGRAFTEKVVGFACAAGGDRSYMSVMNLANALMLDFRSVIVPRFVYATGASFDEDGAIDDGSLAARLDELASDVVRFTTALRGR